MSYCQHCNTHQRSPEALRAELDAMAPVFDAILWVCIKLLVLVPQPIRQWFKDHEGPGTESTGPR